MTNFQNNTLTEFYPTQISSTPHVPTSSKLSRDFKSHMNKANSRDFCCVQSGSTDNKDLKICTDTNNTYFNQIQDLMVDESNKCQSRGCNNEKDENFKDIKTRDAKSARNVRRRNKMHKLFISKHNKLPEFKLSTDFNWRGVLSKNR